MRTRAKVVSPAMPCIATILAGKCCSAPLACLPPRPTSQRVSMTKPSMAEAESTPKPDSLLPEAAVQKPDAQQL